MLLSRRKTLLWCISILSRIDYVKARFVNDYRNISHKPNVEFRLRKVKDVNGRTAIRMSLFTLVDVGKGEELLISYGKGFWKERQLGCE